MLTTQQELQRDRLDRLERYVREALQILDTTRGRAAVDQRGVGACRSLLERSLQSLETIRREILNPFPRTCACGDSYDEQDWKELRYVGIQDDGEGGRLELRDCVTCQSTLAIALPKPTTTEAA